MKKTIKKILCCSLLAVCLVCLLLAGACSNNEEAKLSLNFNQTTIEIGDSFTLIAKKDDGSILRDLQFKSSDASIVTVSQDGVVFGEKSGTAKITATKDGKSATCDVTVIQGDAYPTLLFNSVGNGEDSYTIYDDMSIDLSSKIFFKGDYYDDLTQTITLSNPSAGNIQNGVFVANTLAQGQDVAETKVMITAEWRGFTTKLLYKEVNLRIIRRSTDSAYFNVNGEMFLEDLQLYSVASLGGENYDTEEEFTYELYVNNQKQENLENVTCTVHSIDSEYEVAKIESNKIVATGGGRAEISLKYEVDGNVLANLITVVNVTIPYANNDIVVDNVSAMDGITVPDSLFGGEQVRRAVQNMGTSGENELTVENGISYGLQTVSKAKTDTTVTFFTATRGYTVSVEGYTKIIDEADDLKVLDVSKITEGKLDGYFFVANDIDATSFECTTATANDGTNLKGFIGTFDGNGKTIHFNGTKRYGLFVSTGDGSLIKDLGITIKQLNPTSWEHHRNFNLFGTMHHGTTVKNVAINYTPEAGTTVIEATNLLAYKLYERVALTDVYIYYGDNLYSRDFNNGGSNSYDKNWQAGYLAGYMMSGCRNSGLMSNVRVVNKNYICAGSVNGLYAENESDEVFENQPLGHNDWKYKLPGVFRYDTVAELKTDVGSNKVGNWIINNDGTFTWGN